MRKRILNTTEKILFWSMVIASIVWFFFFINKGMDLTDQAYYLTRYKYFFDADINVKNQGTILTDALGALFYNLSDSYQVLVLSLCSWVLYLGSGLLVYVTLRKYIPRILLLIAVLAGSFFSFTWVHILNYNATSMFIQTLSICVLIKGIEKEKNIYYAISGVLFSINTFFRLPNILQISLGAGVLWYYLFCKNVGKKVIKPFLIYISGIFMGIIFGFLVSIYLNGLDSIYGYFINTAKTAGSSENSHGIINILEGVYTGLKEGVCDWIKYGWLLVIILIAWNVSHILFKSKSKIQKILMILLVVFLSMYSVWVRTRISYLQFFQMTAVCVLTVMMAGMFYYRKSKPFVSTVCMICFCAEIILPIGTNNAWNYQMVFFIFPLCACLLAVCQNTDYRIKSNLILCTVYYGVLLISIGINFAGNYVYRDEPYKELEYGVHAEEYYGIKTSADRAQYIDELDDVLKPLEDRKLLAYGDFNIGYVISDMKPFFEKIWADLESYSQEDFKRDIEMGVMEDGYPVILLADVDQNEQYRDMEKLEMIKKTLDKGKYKVYYENEWYHIYIPEE